jgi:DNA-binding Lrp family transcriptional regulator
MATPGPAPYQPTPAALKLVFDWRVAGISEREIARRLRLNRGTLRARFAAALQAAVERREEAVSDEERLIALRAMHAAARRGSVPAIIWLLRAMSRAEARQARQP